MIVKETGQCMLNVNPIWWARLACCLWVSFSGNSYAADTVKGSEIYGTYCASCHGSAGSSIMPNVPSFDQGEGLFQSDLALLNSIADGKNGMPSYLGILSDSDILDVIAYLRTLN